MLSLVGIFVLFSETSALAILAAEQELSIPAAGVIYCCIPWFLNTLKHFRLLIYKQFIVSRRGTEKILRWIVLFLSPLATRSCALEVKREIVQLPFATVMERRKDKESVAKTMP